MQTCNWNEEHRTSNINHCITDALFSLARIHICLPKFAASVFFSFCNQILESWKSRLSVFFRTYSSDSLFSSDVWGTHEFFPSQIFINIGRFYDVLYICVKKCDLIYLEWEQERHSSNYNLNYNTTKATAPNSTSSICML